MWCRASCAPSTSTTASAGGGWRRADGLHRQGNEAQYLFIPYAKLNKIYPDHTALERTLELLQHYPQVAHHEISDLFLGATMVVNAITRIYTYNQQHLTRFAGIEVLVP